jgi:flagellar biosynthetic protein FliQ
MTVELVTGLMAETVRVILFVAAPVLIVGLVVGVVISLIQAATQVQEITLVFVPKIVACLIALIAALPWMMATLITYTQNLFQHIPMYVG